MKNLYRIIILIVAFILISPVIGNAQCKNFAKKICKLELDPYIHDGNYNAAILTEGEEAELYKTFYADQEYRIAVCGSDALPPVQFRLLDLERNVLYDNAEAGYSQIWDFSMESSQQLIISVKVMQSEAEDEENMELISGCVSIMFGIKEN